MNNNQCNDCVGTKFVKPSYYKKCILVMRCKSQIDAKTIIGSEAKLAIDIPVIMSPAIRKYKE